jgi:hypothetical protein
MTENAAHASPVAGRSPRMSFAIATIAALFMTVTGALGTGEAPLWARLLFWLTVMNSGSLIGMSVGTAVHTWGRLNRSPWVEGLAVATGIAAPLTLVVISARSLIFEMPMPSLSGVAWMFFYVWIVSVAMTALDTVVSARAVEPANVAARAPLADDKFGERLPLHLRTAALMALEAEDHYLRVHTDAGDTLILLRLSDAIAEIGPESGAQTHRSWWVARAAVQSGVKRDGKGELTLSNGLKAPVSRSYLSTLANAGWFGPRG